MMKLTWLCVLVVFCSSQNQVQACDWITNQYRFVCSEALTLLRHLGGEMSTAMTSFPQSLYRKIGHSNVKDQVKFLAEATEQIIELFEEDLDAAKWNSRALTNFQNILHFKQLKELKQCAAVYPDSPRSSYSSNLRRHFRHLKRMLKKNNYSQDSWERVRTVVKTHLLRMDIIAANVRVTLSS